MIIEEVIIQGLLEINDDEAARYVADYISSRH
jgi:hypothetical protein